MHGKNKEKWLFSYDQWNELTKCILFKEYSLEIKKSKKNLLSCKQNLKKNANTQISRYILLDESNDIFYHLSPLPHILNHNWFFFSKP